MKRVYRHSFDIYIHDILLQILSNLKQHMKKELFSANPPCINGNTGLISRQVYGDKITAGGYYQKNLN